MFTEFKMNENASDKKIEKTFQVLSQESRGSYFYIFLLLYKGSLIR